MANTIPQHGTSQSSQPQQQAGIAQPPQGQLGGKPSLTGSQVQGSPSGLVDKLAQTADESAHKAIERVQETRERARSGIERQQAQLGERIREVSEALRGSGLKLKDNDAVASLLDGASERVDRLASYVDTASPRSVARDLHDFARDKPAWFFGGAFLAGLALGRFAKSSARAASEELSDAERLRASERMRYPTGDSTSRAGMASSSAGAYATGRPGTDYSAGSTPSGQAPGSKPGGYGAGSPPSSGSSTPSQTQGATPGAASVPSGYSKGNPAGTRPTGSGGAGQS